MRYIEFDRRGEFDIVSVRRVAIDFNSTDIHKPSPESKSFNEYLGGSPADTAVGPARLGRKVGFVGKASDDRFGEFVVNCSKKEGIDVSGISKAKNGESLGLAFAEISSLTENSTLVYRNGTADLQLDADDIDEDYTKNTKATVIPGTALAMSPSREAIPKALRPVKKNRTVVILDVDYKEHSWKGKDETATYYSIVGKESDIIMGSREEFDLMEGLVAKGSTDGETAKRWSGYGNKIVVIKHGRGGSTVYARDGKACRIKSFPVKLLKPFGGGDAHVSALIYGILEGWDMMDTPEFGSTLAATLVVSHSCLEDMSTAETIKEFIEKEKEEYGKMVARS